MPWVSSSSSRSFSIQRFSIEYDGWWISSGVPELAGDRGRLRRLLGRVRRDAGVQRLARAHGVVQRHHRLGDRRLGVEAVGVEDVDVVQAHPGQRLVERGEHVLARTAALAVGTGPHVPAGLGRDDHLVAVRREVLLEERAEVDLRLAVRRTVVVGQVEVGHPAVERPAQHRPLGLGRLVVAEVLPQPQRDDRELEAAGPGEAVLHAVVAVLRSVVWSCGPVCRRPVRRAQASRRIGRCITPSSS